jgi:hypothetical protein
MSRKSSPVPNKIPRKNVLPLVLVLVIGGVIVGIGMFLSTTVTHFVVYTAVLVGLIGSAPLLFAMNGFKVRGIVMALILTLTISIIIYGTYRIAEYFHFRKLTADAIMQSSGLTANQSQLDEKVDSILQRETGVPGFFGYLKVQFNQGMEITSPFGSKSTIKGTDMLFYWGLDFLFIALVIGVLAVPASRRLYCDHCGKFYGGMFGIGATGAEEFGRVSWNTTNHYLRLIDKNDFQAAGKLIESNGYTNKSLLICIDRCDSCIFSPIYLTASPIDGSYATRGQAIYKRVISAKQYEILIESDNEVTRPDGLDASVE